MRDAFRKFAKYISDVAGTPQTFAAAILLIIIWGTTGPFYAFSDTWQLVINTGTTIITFLMVFLIQNTQNRDSEAMQLKLDELIRVVRRARKGLIDVEDLSDEELKRLEQQFSEMRIKRSGN